MQVIELEGSETINLIHDLLDQATESQVVLVIPRGCEALESNEVNLKVLRRWADNLALRLALVVQDGATRVLAHAAGFVVLPSVAAAQKADLPLLDRKRRRREGLPPRPYMGSLFGAPGASGAGKPTRFNRATLLLAAGGVFLAIVLAALLLLPTATVAVRLATEPVAASMEISGVSGLADVNYGAGQVPARTVSVERVATDTIATTDKRDVPDGHAEGSVVFANRTTTPVTITKGTLVRTSFGRNVRFFTVADVGLPGQLHGTVRARILAEFPGPDGNVPSLTINVVEGEMAAQAEVLNDARTSGGTVRRMSVVHGDDKVRLRATLMRQVQEEAYKELIAGLGPSDFIPQESLVISVLEEEFDHKVGDMVDTLGLTMAVRVNGLAVSGAAGEKLLLALLQQRMQPGYRLVEGSARFQRGGVLEATQEQARFQMTAQASIAQALETRSVQGALAGKTVQQSAAYLKRQFKLIADPEIELTASPLGRLPWLGSRIRVQVTAE
jgi:hypothetical protein